MEQRDLEFAKERASLRDRIGRLEGAEAALLDSVEETRRLISEHAARLIVI